MLRLRSLGRTVQGTVRGLLARPFRAVGSILRPVGAALGALARTVARITRPIVRPFRRIARPLKGFLGDLVGLVPALLAGAGVFLVVAGLFNYFSPAALPSPSPSDVVASASPAPYSLPPRVTAEPSGSGNPSPGPSGTAALAIATRVVIPALNIDDPIVASPHNEQYPLCNVAEYLSLDKVYAYPGAPQAVYLYAHARVHMFWNLLVSSKVNDGAAMIGMWVEVYTDDDQRHIYEISRVIRHVPATTTFADQALAATTDQLWLQTSEGHANSSTKLQIVAMPIGVLAASHADAHPAGRGSVCPDAPLCTAPNQGGCRR
ncbi:MAG: hypothetical protein ABSD62_10510 [Candidatus Limnocylindrales bacterium]|jgi:hypothetical protein